MEFVDLLKHLHMSAKGGIETFLTYDSVQELPPEQFAQLERLQIIVETQPAKYYTCNECVDEDCSGITLFPFKDKQTGQTVGLFSCGMEGGEGLKRVDMNRLRQWDILPDKIEAYLASVEPQSPEPLEASRQQSEQVVEIDLANFNEDKNKTYDFKEEMRILAAQQYIKYANHKQATAAARRIRGRLKNTGIDIEQEGNTVRLRGDQAIKLKNS